MSSAEVAVPSGKDISNANPANGNADDIQISIAPNLTTVASGQESHVHVLNGDYERERNISPSVESSRKEERLCEEKIIRQVEDFSLKSQDGNKMKEDYKAEQGDNKHHRKCDVPDHPDNKHALTSNTTVTVANSSMEQVKSEGELLNLKRCTEYTLQNAGPTNVKCIQINGNQSPESNVVVLEWKTSGTSGVSKGDEQQACLERLGVHSHGRELFVFSFCNSIMHENLGLKNLINLA
ncbi:hypothetical protein PoB_001249000 [Plakobranchus ocellatus]|uniref:Uncharacterized protein n=1 Tax=Plakobranchus ocellatus TaxID=259542 RepID=A0AAV3YS63_9GAST|nr:hypothetical protein PoB_001249000 [Plakobranchus ocellatus]